MSSPEIPRTWTLWRTTDSTTDMRWISWEHDDIGGPIEVVEKTSVDAERERILDLIERLCANLAAVKSQRPGIPGFDVVVDAEALLCRHDRLPKGER